MSRAPLPRLCLAALVVGFALTGGKSTLTGAEPPCAAEPLPQLPPDPREILFGSHVPRTMALLSNSTPTRRHRVKILLYGQSITRGMDRSCLEFELRRRFPHADLVFENRAISGFSANQLVRSAAIDIPLSYPDLVIFHVYGASSIEYERILADIRRRTTAEIMIWTDHYGNAGVPGDDEYQARIAREDDAAAIVRTLALKYQCELVEARPAWRSYLDTHGLPPSALLTDNVHLNDRGKALLTALILRHFRPQPSARSDWMQAVRSYEAKRALDEGARDEIVFPGTPWVIRGGDAVGREPSSRLKLTFHGNRVDLVPGSGRGLSLGRARILIDGRSPSEHPELYATTLPTPAFGADYQPGIRRVGHRAPLQEEDWTLRVISAHEQGFSFELHGSRTGFDGRGEFTLGRLRPGRFGVLEFANPEGDLPEAFVSNSGRVVLEHRDFKVLWGQERAGKRSPDNWEITWRVVPQFLDTYSASVAEDEALLAPVTLAQGLPPGEHTLEIIPLGDGAVPIREIVVHRPPLP